MGSTYLDVTNQVIRRINEVELTETSFPSVRGVQAVVKDAVRDSIKEINQQKWEWPYHTVETTQLLTIGTNTYSFPANLKNTDWKSFQIVKDDSLDVRNTNLIFIDRDEWYTYQKDIDDDAGTDGRMTPRMVFKNQNSSFGVTPSPDKAYTVSYTYFKNPTALSLHSDVIDIPSEYDNVIIAGALYHMNLFKENVRGVEIAEKAFRSGITLMFNNLVGSSDRIYDTRVNFGGLPMLGQSGNYKL